jgi:TonB family protein
MSAVVILMLLAADVTAVQAERQAPPERARANLNSYFSADDYPAASLRAWQEGTTDFRLLVGPDGRVAACQVAHSSGFQALDKATCSILRARARYSPARDGAGNPTEGTDNGRVTWRLPGPAPDRAGIPGPYIPASLASAEATQPAPGDYPAGTALPAGAAVTWIRAAVGPAGQVLGCDILTGSGSAALDAAACRIFSARARFTPARDVTGQPVCDIHWAGINWRSAAPRQVPPPAGGPVVPAPAPPPLERQFSPALCF